MKAVFQIRQRSTFVHAAAGPAGGTQPRSVLVSVDRDALHGAQDFQAKAFIRGQYASMGLQFPQRGECHAEVHSAQGTATDDTLAPARFVRDFFDLFVRAWIKADEPLVATDVTFGLALGFKPWIAQLYADGTAIILAEAIKCESRIHFCK